MLEKYYLRYARFVGDHNMVAETKNGLQKIMDRITDV